MAGGGAHALLALNSLDIEVLAYWSKAITPAPIMAVIIGPTAVKLMKLGMSEE